MTIGQLIDHLDRLKALETELEQRRNDPPFPYRPSKMSIDQLHALDDWQIQLDKIRRKIRLIRSLII
jgi:hypothetical protein